MPRLSFVFWIAMLGAGALAARAANGFFPALNDPAPPLAHAPPYGGAPAAPPLARKVALVIVDGLRLDAADHMPALTALRGSRGRARAGFPTISKANYLTIVVGVPPRYSGSRTNDGFVPHAIDSLVAHARHTAYVSERTRGISRLFSIDDAVAEAGDLAAPFRSALGRADLTILFFISVDEAGHARGAASDAYAAAVASVDARIGAALAGFDFTRDAVVITADHGHTARGGHGGLGDELELVPLVLAGAGIREGGTLDAELVDVAPTVAALLGISPPGHGTGRTLIEALDVSPETARALEAADAARLAHVRPLLARIDEGDRDALATQRMWRTPLALLLVGALLALGRRRVSPGAALVAAVFAVVFYAVTFGIAPLTVPSSATAVWGHTAIPGGVALLAQLVAVGIAARRGVLPLGWLACAIAAVPALLAWALADRALATLLPGTVLVVVSPYAYAGVAYQVIGAVLGAALARMLRRVPDTPA